MKKLIKIFSDLCKIRISLLATLASATGCILAKGVSKELVFSVPGVFLLACGSCALNQFQERKTDLLMERTKHRPIPSGKIRPHSALLFSLLLIVSGGAILLFRTNLSALTLGIFTLFWYNGVYTPLKRKSNFATIPGALVGALTPAIGWLAGGGNIFAPQILVIVFFFFIWQIPHFWLNLLHHRHDYEDSGLPSFIKVFTAQQLTRITFIWLLATAATCLLLPLFIVNSYIINLSLFVLTLWLIWSASGMFIKKEKEIFIFREINIYALLVISLLSLGKLFNL